MSNTPGAIIVIAPIEAPDGASFAPFDDLQMSGGSHAVVDAAARDALPAHLLKPGTVATLPSGSQFVWNGTAWIAPAGGGAVTSVAGRIGDVVLSTADISGLGNSATRDVGTVAGTVAAGDDSRLSNARTPTSHAASHATGGSDQITPAAIGAEVSGAATTALAAHVAAGDPHSQYQRESERAAANGYASLDAATKVPLAQLPTGTSSSTVALGDAPTAAVATHTGLPDPHPQYALESALGGAAALDVGTTAGTVAAGNDARFTDARTPTAHAASHASAGGDPISPASIGAEVAGATATHAALTTAHGESAFNATLKTSANAPAARTVLGLPASATRTITHSSSPPSGGVAGDIHFQIP